MTDIPAAVSLAADRRAAARVARDWATADALRAEIEAAGWKVVDFGTRYRLEPAYVADTVEGDTVRYGRVESVPSRLDEPDAAPASVIVVAGGGGSDASRAVAAIRSHAPAVPIAVVADGVGGDEADSLRSDDVEVVRTAAPLGFGAALQIGIRRASGSIVVLVDPSVEATGDLVTPLVAALEDPSVAVAGAFGLVTADLRRFDEVASGDAAAIEGYVMAFRRRDARDRGPVDDRFRFDRNADIWWSLVLRDEGEGRAPRRALVVPDLPLVRHEHRGWTSVVPAERERSSKRNFYRILDRFGHRHDLVVEGR